MPCVALAGAMARGSPSTSCQRPSPTQGMNSSTVMWCGILRWLSPVIAVRVLPPQGAAVVPRRIDHREPLIAERLALDGRRLGCHCHLMLAGWQLGGGDTADRVIGV